jgi:hypothetical protein
MNKWLETMFKSKWVKVVAVLIFSMLMLSCEVKVHLKSSDAQNQCNSIDSTKIDSIKKVLDKSKFTISKNSQKGIDSFLESMAKFESQNKLDTINQYGMMGKYQFKKSTLEFIGITASPEEFLSDESLQDSAMVIYLNRNKRTLRNVIRDFAGKTYNGIPVTVSGILAGAHLVGPGGVLSYFYPDKYDFPISDANGMHVERYMIMFGGYKL